MSEDGILATVESAVIHSEWLMSSSDSTKIVIYWNRFGNVLLLKIVKISSARVYARSCIWQNLHQIEDKIIVQYIVVYIDGINII